MMIFLARNWLTIFATTRAGDLGAPQGRLAVAGDQQDLAEDQLVAGHALAMVDLDEVTFLNAVLVASVFENSVHS